MKCQVRGMADASRPRVSDTLPRRGRVNEVCREWVVHEDEALAYQLQKQEVEQHYENNKERNARVREDFPKAKEEQEKEIMEAAEKYRQMIRQQEKVDSTYARRVAAKLEREEFEKRRRAEIHDLEVARMMQVCEITRNTCRTNGENDDEHVEHVATGKVLPVATPDVNRIGLPFLENVNFEPEAVIGRHQANVAVTHSLRNLRLKDDNHSNNDVDSKNGLVEERYVKTCIRKDSGSNCATTSSTVHLQSTQHTIRTPTPAVVLPPDINEILCDADLQEEANRRLQEEKDAELARMLQKQEEEILNEELGRDRMMAIEAQDKELAKLLYEKEKAKLKRAKERARQRALLKKQQQLQSPSQQQQQLQSQDESTSPSTENSAVSTPAGTIPFTLRHVERGSYTNGSLGRSEQMIENVGDESDESSFPASSLTSTSSRIAGPSITNVAMHIDPTYLSQQSACTPNSLMFQDGDTTVPPYMPIQGQRRNSPFIDKKQKKSKSKDSCKQQ